MPITFTYTPHVWENDQVPDIDEDNLNEMEAGISNAQYPTGGDENYLLAQGASGTKKWMAEMTAAEVEAILEDDE